MDQHNFSSQLHTSCAGLQAEAEAKGRRCAELAAAEAALDADIAERLARIASLQMARQVDFGQQVQLELRLRQQEEQAEREQLVVLEREIDAASAVYAQHCADYARVDSQADALLASDAEYGVLAREHEQALAAQEAARPVMEDISEECRRKLAGYDADRHYAYLRACGYGTEGYRAWLPARSLDRWIARLCNFHENQAAERTLHSMLQEIARRREELARMVEETGGRAQRHADVAGNQAGLPALVPRIGEQKAVVSDLRDRAQVHRDRLATYAAKSDSRYGTACNRVAEILKAQSIDELVIQAQKTASIDDDALVSEIITLAGKRKALQQEYVQASASYREAQQAHARAMELSNRLESTLPRHGSAEHHMFGNGLNMALMVASVAAGAVTMSNAMGQVNSHRSVRPRRGSSNWFSGAGSSRSSSSSWSSSSSSSSWSDDSSDSGSSNSGGDSYSTSDSF